MVKTNDCVVLTRELPEHGLLPGDMGAVVFVHREGEAYEIEFVRLDGTTMALLTLSPEVLRPVAGTDIAHVREVQTT